MRIDWFGGGLKVCGCVWWGVSECMCVLGGSVCGYVNRGRGHLTISVRALNEISKSRIVDTSSAQ